MVRPFQNKSGPVTIVSSTLDAASLNIARNLVDRFGFRETNTGEILDAGQNVRLVTLDKPPILVDPTDLPSDSPSTIFASKHVSATNTPALTVHTTGNLTKSAEFGGKPEEVSFVDPARIQTAIRTLRQSMTDDSISMDLTMEATHHGPTSFSVPVCFVEIGSGPTEWSDPRLGRIVAEAIVEAAKAAHAVGKPVVGFGGTHYSAKFTRLCLRGEYAIGHIVPRQALEAGTSDVILRDTLSKTVGPRATALVDWKGLRGEDRRKLVASLESWGYVVERC